MGVPKFFRYISERYPCLSELVREYQIPAFDNLYLDMNGIIHTCSHPDDSDATFRITEEKIYLDIFHYIEILFRLIKPQKLFFMAVDGVAPRAKMNQQRGRRFRSAKDAHKQATDAKLKKTEIPDTARFDSNCITPGTIFMTKLHEQLKYFVANKITTDKLWQKCTIILSGHETPGEGEHKIMDYIRYARSQSGYDPNTRHCLYGLDADLIMLGLCSHEPHFSLLREEVKFGKKALRKLSPENTTFYMLHLSLMREYLREEFKAVADKIPFEYNLENIIDDWVLMGFLVGNDFIPHLPKIHIHSAALPLLYKTYMTVLPELDGYLNESGTINLRRFQIFMKQLTAIDYSNFEETYDDLQYFKSKTGRDLNTKERKSYKPQELETWNNDEVDEIDKDLLVCLEPENESINKDLLALIKQTDDFAIDDPAETSITALNKIFLMDQDATEERDMQIELEFQLHKKNYYETKMHLLNLTSDTLVHLTYEYIRALQWILHYYYNGVCSWSWFYPYHYAPYLSDIKDFTDMKLEFDLSKPFLPYEQLLAVLPPASKDSLPTSFHSLMTDPLSPIKDFYPDTFDTDLNGKRQEWEAVVLIPFIDEERLINAMALALTQLTTEESERNTHGPMQVYRYAPNEDLGSYYAPEYFPTIQVNRAICTPLTKEAIYIPRAKLVKGVCKGVAQDIYYPGFPTTRHLKYKSMLLKKKVKVFDQPSHDYNMILSIEPPLTSEAEEPEICDIAVEYLGKTVFVCWPHLTESKVVAVSNEEYRYNISPDGKGYNVIENQGNLKKNFLSEKSGIETYYLERRGIDVGPTSVLVHVRELVGRRYEFLNEGKMRVNLSKKYADATTGYPLQMLVQDINTYDDYRSTFQQLSDLFRDGIICFMLGQPHYGAVGKVIHCQESFDKGRVKVCMQVAEDPNFSNLYRLNDSILNEYYSSHAAATRLSLYHGTLSRITGTILICRGGSKNLTFDEASKVNVGLNVKNTRRNQGLPGYVKSIDSKWYYSGKCLQLVDDYRNEFFALFQYLNASDYNNVLHEVDIFPDDKGDGTSIKKIQEWLNKQPHTVIEMQHSDSKTLEAEVVFEMEEMLSLYNENVRPKQIKMAVRPHLIHISGLICGNVCADNSVTFSLFDRVVNVRECYTVPIGYSGTVIAIHKVLNNGSAEDKKDDVLVDVLYDKPFAGGLPLNNCSPNRGYRMSPNDLINKSHGDRKLNIQLEKKTPNYQGYKPMQPQSSSQSSAFVTWNNSNYLNSNITRAVPQNKGPPMQHIQNIPLQIERQEQIYPVNKTQSISYNENNTPIVLPPLETSNHPHQINNYNQSNNVPFSENANSMTQNKESPSKAFTPNNPNVQISSSSNSPKRSTQRQLDSPAKENNSLDTEVSEAKMERRRAGTEMLRNLLQMNAQENEKMDQNPSKASGSISVDNFFQMAQSSQQNVINNSDKESQKLASSSSSACSWRQPPPPMLPSPGKEFPSALLLSFFVAHGMGCPMYTYSHLQSGCKAEVQIPTNRGNNMVVVSSLCATRDVATEDVAVKTLEQLKTVDLSIFMPEIPQFPTPPRQWCTDNQTRPTTNITQGYSNRTGHLERSPRYSDAIKRNYNHSSTKNPSFLSAGAVPFVPLQVTRKQSGKSVGSTHMDAIVRNNIDNGNNRQSTSNILRSPQQNIAIERSRQQIDFSTTETKPTVARQMRLAANFNNMPS